MQEFMLYIRNRSDHDTSWPANRRAEFLKKCELYIDGLKKNGILIAAQPLGRQGSILSGAPGQWKESPIDEQDDVYVGYYHIRAKDVTEAIAIAKENPEFEYSSTASAEVRLIKTVEETTGYQYPSET